MVSNGHFVWGNGIELFQPNPLLVYVTVSVIAFLLIAYLSFYSPTDDFHIQVFFLFSLVCMLFVYPDDVYDDYSIWLLSYKNLTAERDSFPSSGILKFDFQEFCVMAVLAL